MANDYAATYGTKLYYGTAGAAAASITTQLAGIDSLPSLPELNFDEFETTRIDQAGIMKEFAASLGDGGNIQVNLGFKKADVASLFGFVRTSKAWKILFSEGSTLHGDGWLKVLGFGAESGDEILVKATVRCSGTWTFAAAA